jgi:hypothetical protein
MEMNFPKCQKCATGVLVPLSDYGRNGASVMYKAWVVPLSDYGRNGASVMYKAWVCTNPDCGFNLRIDNGEISI